MSTQHLTPRFPSPTARAGSARRSDESAALEENTPGAPSSVPHLARAATPSVFTLGSALRWLGHDLPTHQCLAPVTALPASIWFLLADGPDEGPTMRTRVLVDLPTTTFHTSALIRGINELDRIIRSDDTMITYRHATTRQPGDPGSTTFGGNLTRDKRW